LENVKYQGHKKKREKQGLRRDHISNGGPNPDRFQRKPTSWPQRQGNGKRVNYFQIEEVRT
jgi:hypothetical protein